MPVGFSPGGEKGFPTSLQGEELRPFVGWSLGERVPQTLITPVGVTKAQGTHKQLTDTLTAVPVLLQALSTRK